jgi:hypothetical protein
MPPPAPSPNAPELFIGQVEATFLNNVTYYEKVGIPRIYALLKSDKLLKQWDVSNYGQARCAELYENQTQQLQRYLAKLDTKTGLIPVKYSRGQQKYGRVYPEKSLGMTGFSKKVRNTIIEGDWLDFDLENAQVQIIKCLVEHNDLPREHITYYCEHREEVWHHIAKVYRTTTKPGKKLFLRLAFGSTVKSWCEEFNIDTDLHDHIDPFVQGFLNELDTVIQECRKKNELLYDTIRVLDRKKYLSKQQHEKQLIDSNKVPPKYKPKYQWKYQARNLKGKFFASYLQEIETRIINQVVKWLDVTANVITDPETNKKVLIYEFDGLKLYLQFVDAYPGGKEQLINDLNKQVQRLTGFDMTFVEKPIEDVHDISEELNSLDVATVGETNGEYFTEKYVAMKAVFEANNAKLYGGKFVSFQNEQFNILSEKEMRTTFRHWSHGTDKQKRPIRFIDVWFDDPGMRYYTNLQMVPPPLICPVTSFNIWTPFKAQQATSYTSKPLVVETFLNHLRIVLGTPEMYTYITEYIAHLCQYPGIKPGTVPCFVGLSGTGKSSIFVVLKDMLGEKKVKVSSTPERDVWGTFNDMLEGKILVVLEELEKKIGKDGLEKFKDLITNDSITINGKNQKPYESNSFHRFMIATNDKEGPVPTSKDDRRFVMIKISNELKGNDEYFKQFRHIVDVYDDDAMCTLFGHFNNKQNYDVANFHLKPKPTSEFQKELADMNRPYMDIWFEEFTRKMLYDIRNTTSDELTCTFKMPQTTEALFEDFNAFLLASKIHSEFNKTKFGTHLALLANQIGDQQPNAMINARCSRTGRKIWKLNYDALGKYYSIEIQREKDL